MVSYDCIIFSWLLDFSAWSDPLCLELYEVMLNEGEGKQRVCRQEKVEAKEGKGGGEIKAF